MQPSAATFFVDNQTLNVSYDIEQGPVVSENFYCALFLTKEGLFIPITDRDEFLKLFCIGSMNAESVFKLIPIGKEIAAIINNAPCKVKLVKLFSTQIGLLQFVAAYGSACVAEYVNLDSFISSLLKQTFNSSSFVNEAKFCINGLNQKINSMEDTVGLYKKELEQVKSELNEHLILCSSYNGCAIEAVATEMPSGREFQFVAFPATDKLTWMGIDVRNKVLDLFNRLTNQAEDFAVELALNMWGIRILIGNDISTKTIQFRQDPPLVLKDPTGYELYTRILFRWYCSEAIISEKVMIEDYCNNKEHWDSMLSDTFYNEELPKILKRVREKTDSYEKIKKGSNYDPIYYQVLSNRGKPTPEWNISLEALPVAYRMGYDDSFECQSPMIRLIRMFEEGKTTGKDFKDLCHLLHFPELVSTAQSSSSLSTPAKTPTISVGARGRGRPRKEVHINVDSDSDYEEGKKASSALKKYKLINAYRN